MPAPDKPLLAALELLSTLEREEARFLSWGLVDTPFTYDEVEALARKHAREHGGSAEDLLVTLYSRKLLFDFRYPSGQEVVRTRMAETVRLLAQLRQLFPRHNKPEHSWHEAARLVSDFRFAVKPRLFPARTVSAEDVLLELSKAHVQLSQAGKRALEVIVGDRRLAEFQARATVQSLLDLRSSQPSRGLIVTAGTGTGKTMAFYVPALVHLVGRIEASPQVAGVRVLALYPRNELLKDQLTTALGYLNTLNKAGVLRKRPLSVGTLYGAVPKDATEKELKAKRWERTGGGWICPFFRDPEAQTEVDALVWRDNDLREGREQLFSLEDPRRCYGPELVRLTRKRMVKEPPDVLVSSMEMLNRTLAHPRMAHLYGLGSAVPLDVVLLDEAHTYEGTTGAQSAYALRRWRHALRRTGKPGQPQFVGLSATLEEAEAFFGTLTGVGEHAVVHVEAKGAVERGHEYLIALRGDPFAGASLLSTSIQTAMLLARALDPIRGVAPSQSTFGSRTFLFTDDLDVTNRFYDNLADAEGLVRGSNGYRPGHSKGKVSLASLRHPENEDSDMSRFAGGQSWRMPVEIGHDLSSYLQIDRVSSQDAGVASEASLVVATASLEVGFDDNRVGAVLQHKAPRGAAAYLQRKGRAGRLQHMRPWTAVVLSAYGRDGLLYQNYEQLFSPRVEATRLPLGNRYVQRIHATYALLDWIAWETFKPYGPQGWVSPWSHFRRPPSGDFEEKLRAAYLNVVHEVLREPDGGRAQSMTRWIEKALGVDDAALHAVLWEAPRSLFLEVMPTLQRRLERGFGTLAGGSEYADNPLPEFLPGKLFGDLNLPEVTLDIPERMFTRKGETRKVEEAREASEGVEQVLRQYAPGRVNRRHATTSAFSSHWVPLPWEHEPQLVRLGVQEVTGGALDSLGAHPAGALGESVEVFRPYRLVLAEPPREVLPSSNSRPRWWSHLMPPPGSGVAAESFVVPSSDVLARFVPRIDRYTHAFGRPLETVRYTPGAEARLLVKLNPKEDSVEYAIGVEYHHLTAEGEMPAALGFHATVDALAFHVPMPSGVDLATAVASDSVWHAQTRAALLRELIQEEDVLLGVNTFQRGWLYRLLLTALCERALDTSASIEQVAGEWGHDLDTFERALQRGLVDLLAAGFVGVDEAEDTDQDAVSLGRHGNRLRELLSRTDVLEDLLGLARTLWADEGAAYHSWLQRRYKTTLGAALVQTCALFTPGQSEEGLLLDLQATPHPLREADEATLWISESALGGTGLIEAIGYGIAQDAQRFGELVANALEASELEAVADEMDRLVAFTGTTPGAAAMADLRAARGAGAAQGALVAFERAVRHHVGPVAPAAHSAFAARLLTPGTSEAHDALVRALAQRWHRWEQSLGVELAPRLVAHLASRDASMQTLFEGVAPLADASAHAAWRAGMAYALLWSRGGLVRELALKPYSPYADYAPTDRKLVLGAGPGSPVVSLDSPAWFDEVAGALQETGSVRLVASSRDESAVSQALMHVLARPVELGFLHLYPLVRAVRRDADTLTLHLALSLATG